ncbi:aminoacyl-tRNA hydrolase [Spirochaetia bacterium 38H-sp]|uniref:Peptidyl-tRNA hydrolase n=1 Tax=Rarispira pelagica TaxID=3141764 RepID=A0ABU9UE24_9SPIR
MARTLYILGLGNPGKRYASTRHNVGWWLVDSMALYFNLSFSLKKNYEEAFGNVKGNKVVLIKPLTYMNNSGSIFKNMFFPKDGLPDNLIICADQVDLSPGNGRLRLAGGHAGHNGIKSIISDLGTNNFYRYYIGVGRQAPGQDLADYVLSIPTPDEKTRIFETIERFVNTFNDLLNMEYQRVMEVLNKRYYND